MTDPGSTPSTPLSSREAIAEVHHRVHTVAMTVPAAAAEHAREVIPRPRDEGVRLGWPSGAVSGDRAIVVPFSWGAPLSGVPDCADIGLTTSLFLPLCGQIQRSPNTLEASRSQKKNPGPDSCATLAIGHCWALAIG